MKPLLASAGVIALMVSAAACDSPERLTYETPVELAGTTVSEEAAAAQAEAASTSFQLASGEVEASDLIGAAIYDASGEQIATVSDIWLAGSGAAPMIVVREGGVAGAGGELHTVAFTETTIAPDPDTVGEEPKVIVQYTGETIKTLPKFEQASADDYRLASEIMGTMAAIAYTGENARIHDLILTPAGEARFAVISPDLVSMNQVVVDARALTIAEGDTDGALVLDLTAEDIAVAPEYPVE
ncbi:MAG TPA: PRC-barrel domain-containing protein [Hyphomonas sp.]|nr:hypothetical protein [Hyphomonas sp.]HRI99950.1 PRC-barrel domain-containing protein [Hyphomonas sp.]HRK69363.1 PRC-barrel domain-containing protein [Hyphomonas sp.]